MGFPGFKTFKLLPEPRFLKLLLTAPEDGQNQTHM